MYIRRVTIQNFRSIKDQTIDDIESSLALIGKNNSGKSAFLTAIMAFFGKYPLADKDIHKGSTELYIELEFQLDEAYYSEFLSHPKLGISKLPSNNKDFLSYNVIENIDTWDQFKELRADVLANNDYETIMGEYPQLYDTWLNFFKNYFEIKDERLKVSLYKRSGENPKYYTFSGNENKLVTLLLPRLAIIDEERSFEAEESGGASTLTQTLFKEHIIPQSDPCYDCTSNECDACCRGILNEVHSPDQLSLGDLQKLINYKYRGQSSSVSANITRRFQENFHNSFSVSILPKAKVNKSVSIQTSIWNPAIEDELGLSQVGSGVRSIYVLSLLQAYHELAESSKVIFLFEEPEIYLHPELEKQMSEILSRISNGSQLIFTTHSTLMLKFLPTSSVVNTVLNTNNETALSKGVDMSTIINNLGYSTEDLIGYSFVLFVEGKDDVEIYGKIIQRFYYVDLSRIKILSVEGCGKIGTYASLKFLDDMTFDNFAVIRDGDAWPHQTLRSNLYNQFRENVSKEFADEKMDNLHILQYSAIEAYFLNPGILEHLGVICNHDDFKNRVKRFIKDNGEEIFDYLIKDKIGNQKRFESDAKEIFDNICADGDFLGKFEEIKKYIRGHSFSSIFDQLMNNVEKYINMSGEEDFKDIIDFLDGQKYFTDKKKNRPSKG